MKRRDFALQLAGTGLGLAFASLARAQGAPVEGQQYARLPTPWRYRCRPTKRLRWSHSSATGPRQASPSTHN